MSMVSEGEIYRGEFGAGEDDYIVQEVNGNRVHLYCEEKDLPRKVTKREIEKEFTKQ